MLKALAVSELPSEDGTTVLDVRVETTKNALYGGLAVAVVCLAVAAAVHAKTGAVPWYTFVIIVMAGVVITTQQLTSVASHNALAGTLRISPELRAVEKLSGCGSLAWTKLKMPKRVLLVHRAWLLKDVSGISSRTVKRHELLLIPVRDKDHRERVMDDLLEWHRHHFRRVHDAQERPVLAAESQCIAWGVDPHVALVDALQRHLSQLRGVRLFDISEER
jgi:hypothetical protein